MAAAPLRAATARVTARTRAGEWPHKRRASDDDIWGVSHLLHPELAEPIFAEYMGISQMQGVLDGNQLQPTDTAKTVRVRDGQTLIMDGLPVDRAGVLDGYYLYDAPDLDAAMELAARIPAARMGGTVEVRPVVER